MIIWPSLVQVGSNAGQKYCQSGPGPEQVVKTSEASSDVVADAALQACREVKGITNTRYYLTGLLEIDYCIVLKIEIIPTSPVNISNMTTFTTTSTVVPAVAPGVWCPVVTLYNDTDRQEVDLDACYKYFTYLIRGGVNGLVLLGSTAEAALLSAEERIDLVKIARKAATDQGAPNFPLAAGISGQSTNETLRLADDAAKAGADYGLLLPPCYWPKAMPNDAIVAFYREVADESRIPIIVYNVSPDCQTDVQEEHS